MPIRKRFKTAYIPKLKPHEALGSGRISAVNATWMTNLSVKPTWAVGRTFRSPNYST